MATKKKIDNQKYNDMKDWVSKVINSCQTYEQTRVARRLVDNFYNLMEKDGVSTDVRCDLEYKLRYQLLIVQDQLNKFR